MKSLYSSATLKIKTNFTAEGRFSHKTAPLQYSNNIVRKQIDYIKIRCESVKKVAAYPSDD